MPSGWCKAGGRSGVRVCICIARVCAQQSPLPRWGPGRYGAMRDARSGAGCLQQACNAASAPCRWFTASHPSIALPAAASQPSQLNSRHPAPVPGLLVLRAPRTPGWPSSCAPLRRRTLQWGGGFGCGRGCRQSRLCPLPFPWGHSAGEPVGWHGAGLSPICACAGAKNSR